MKIEKIIEDDSRFLTEENMKRINEALVDDLTKGELKYYFELLDFYYKEKKNKGLTTSDIAQKCDIPEITVRRYENLQSIPKVLTLLKILRTMNLTLKIVPIIANEVNN